MSKGSRRRPLDQRHCTADQYAERYDAIDWGKVTTVPIVLDEKGLRIEWDKMKGKVKK